MQPPEFFTHCFLSKCSLVWTSDPLILAEEEEDDLLLVCKTKEGPASLAQTPSFTLQEECGRFHPRQQNNVSPVALFVSESHEHLTEPHSGDKSKTEQYQRLGTELRGTNWVHLRGAWDTLPSHRILGEQSPHLSQKSSRKCFCILGFSLR